MVTSDRNIAAATPILMIAASFFLPPWLLFALPAALYFTFRRLSLRQSQEVSLVIFDLIISMAIIAIALGAVIASLSTVANDGGFKIPLIFSGIIKSILSLAGTLYFLWTATTLSIKSSQGKIYKPGLSMCIFEALRGKHASNA